MAKLRNLLSRAFLKAAFTVDPPHPHPNVSDDFIMWLCFANAGMLDNGNLYLIDHAIQHLPSAAPILEIGSFCGLSANLLTHFKRKHARKNVLVTCDKWEFENLDKNNPRVGQSPVLFSDYKSFVRESYLRNIQLFSADDLPFTVEATSAEFFSAWKARQQARDVLARPIALGGPLSFCYIDGDHGYNGVKQDFFDCDQFLEPGGFLLFDDSTVPAFGVRELMPEVAATGRYKLVATNPNHLFQKVVT